MAITSFSGQYFYLSNFFRAPIWWEEISFPTNEHAFQAAKTLNMSHRQTVATLARPGDAKRWGRSCNLRPDWEAVKTDVMRELVLIKFTQHADLRQLLVATGDQQLTEGNNWGDKVWGKVNGVGENRLGQILMEVRILAADGMLGR